MRIYHGNIVTCNWKGAVYNYLVEDEGEIVFVGDQLPDIYQDHLLRVELGSRALLPAFGDGHIHFSNWAVINATFDVRNASDFYEIGQIIQDYASKDKKAKILFGYGHSRHSLIEKRLITRSELDQYVKDRPVFLVCYDGHSAVANSKALGILPRKIRDLRGFNLETGQLFDRAFLEAVDFVSGKIKLPTLASYLLQGIDSLAEYGVGLVHNVEGVGYPRDFNVDLVRFLSKSTQVQFRTYFQTMDTDKVLKRDLPRIGGCFACALDGSFGNGDAALTEPYTDDQYNSGVLFYRDEEVTEFVKKANRANLQIQLHCVGDAAVVQAVNALDAALKDYPRKDHRHTLIHACLIPEKSMEKIAELNIGVNIQPGFLISPLEPPRYYEAILGERAWKIWPIKKMLEMGINVSGGSDAPVGVPNPLESMNGACNHYVTDSAVGLGDALCMYTYNIAHTSFDENERGSLEEGKLADMVLLSGNPFETDTRNLDQLKVEKLYFSGEEYDGSKSVLQAIIEGVRNRGSRG
ncbi:MAG: amidohydrolase [Bacillota bacterium]